MEDRASTRPRSMSTLRQAASIAKERSRTHARQMPDGPMINAWLTEKQPNLKTKIKLSDTDFWVWLDASRPTNRMTERNKRHLFRVQINTRNRVRENWELTLDQDINLTARTHWPVQRTPSGHFAKGHGQNVRIVKDRDVIIQNYGSHLWLLEGDTPDDSAWMLWDGKLVDVDTILGLLNFDRHPDNPTASFEAEMMHKPRLKTPTLFDIGPHPLDDE